VAAAIGGDDEAHFLADAAAETHYNHQHYPPLRLHLVLMEGQGAAARQFLIDACEAACAQPAEGDEVRPPHTAETAVRLHGAEEAANDGAQRRLVALSRTDAIAWQRAQWAAAAAAEADATASRAATPAPGSSSSVGLGVGRPPLLGVATDQHALPHGAKLLKPAELAAAQLGAARARARAADAEDVLLVGDPRTLGALAALEASAGWLASATLLRSDRPEPAVTLSDESSAVVRSEGESTAAPAARGGEGDEDGSKRAGAKGRGGAAKALAKLVEGLRERGALSEVRRSCRMHVHLLLLLLLQLLLQESDG
jgi:hypothetical protein